jgi:tetratricopeptide (TPR) repeat protein
LRYMIPQQTSAAFLVTTRNRDIYRKLRNFYAGLQVEEIPLEKFTEDEALALFCRMMGQEYREEDRGIYLEIARDLGYLPIALRQAISLMVYTPHYWAGELRDKLKGDERLALLRRGCAEVESDTRVIEAVFDLSAQVLTKELREVLALLAVCSPGPVPLDFLKRLELSKVLGGVGPLLQKGPDLPEAKVPGLAEIFERLYTYSWCERREMEGERYYELHQLVRDLVRLQGKQETQGELPYLEQFIDVVHEIFTDKDVHYSVKERYFFQLEEAFAAAVERKDSRLKKWLYALIDFCTYRGYAHFYLHLTEDVERLFPGDQWKIKDMYCFRANILKNIGKYEEAMVFYREYEAKCKELGDRSGLSRSYGNQALILNAWGRLKEAMTLLKKQEEICDKLGDRTGLVACYGNQVNIHYMRGKMEEAMILCKKVEEICEELGDRAGLSLTYGNKANIHYSRGELDEAISLHQKEEAICEELGDRVGLARIYSNQALILQARGRLEEAMTLCKKVEKICGDLGYQAGLALTWWNQGCIYEKQGDPHAQAQLWRKAIETRKTIGIPTDDLEKQLKDLMESTTDRMMNDE